MTRTTLHTLFLALALAACSVLTAQAEARPEEAEAPRPPAQKGDTITWKRDLTAAFAEALRDKKVLMICINSARVDGGRREPAAAWLRETIYKDPRVVGASRDFVCVFMNSASSSGDWGELKVRFGIEGSIVSPQHIFSRPDHGSGKPLVREEYWPHGNGENAILHLVGMMDKASKAYANTTSAPDGAAEEAPVAPPPAPDAEPGPDGNEADAQAARAKWLADQIQAMKEGSPAQRDQIIANLIANDKEGDCFRALIAVLEDESIEQLVELDLALVRALGRPQLDGAVEAIAARLKHKDVRLRANAAVSLEYIGSVDAVPFLLKQEKREKDVHARSHMHRALGRCGSEEKKVRSLLCKRASSFKEEIESYGPIIGLAYAEGNAKAARAVEKLATKLGPPSFGRGGGRGTLRRTLLAWCLAEIGDPKSAPFIQEKFLDPMRNVKSRWLARTQQFYGAVKKACEGDRSQMDTIMAGVGRILSFVGGFDLTDEARQGRDSAGFKPKGEWAGGGGGAGGFGGGGN